MPHLACYETRQRLYVVSDSGAATAGGGDTTFRVLALDRTSVPLEAREDPHEYTPPELRRLLATLHAGNQAHGGLQLVCEAQALLGVVQYLEGPYLLLATRRRRLGAICGHKVYGIDGTTLLPVLSPAAHKELFGGSVSSAAEVRCRKLLSGVQLTRDFFFSYTWPIHQTAQRTFSQAPDEWWADGGGPSGGGEAADAAEAAAAGEHSTWGSLRVWNEFLSRPLRDALAASGSGSSSSGSSSSSSGSSHTWVVPIAHGFFEQRPLALLGRNLTLTLIARRSRQFAGTRYLKRGVTSSGHAANDVEIEQVVEAGLDWKSGTPLLASVVQVRGSIPLHWQQTPDSSMLKPEIVLHRFDPLYAATRRHFSILRAEYGEPLCVLDLVKRLERRPRESLLGLEYAVACRYLNSRLPAGQQRVQYQAFDLSHKAKTAKKQLLGDLQRLQEPVLQATGVFVSGGGGGGGTAARQQHGVLRTNCIDSLDRTNVAQFSFGMLALGQQLHALGISESAWLDPASSLAHQLMDAWEAMGHTLAQQYGGSEAHATFFQRQRGDWEAATQGRDLLTTVRRFYSNIGGGDAERQQALNLFLGTFVPAPGKPHVWELGSDAYLHSGPGRGLRALGLAGSRSASFTAGGSAQQATAAAAAAAVAATSVAASSASSEELVSFPHAPSPPRPPPPPRGRLGSPPEHEAPPLSESLSAASLASLSSDGSFAPSLSALVESAAPALLRPLGSTTLSVDAGEEEPCTPRMGVPLAAAAAPAPAAAPAGHGATSPPQRQGPRRSPLLGASRKPPKLESLEKQMAPIAHVRLTAAAKPSKPLGWLSPKAGGSAAAAAAASKKEAAATAAAKAAAKAAVAAAGVAAAPAGVPIPGNLRRSNSDPSLSCSLSNPLPPAGGAAGPGLPPRPLRRVTFDSALAASPSAVAHSPPRAALLRHSTAPTASLDQWAASQSVVGSVPSQLLLMQSGGSAMLGGGSSGSSLHPAGSSHYHALAGLNLEGSGAAAAEASMRPGGAPPAAAAAPLPKPPTRRLSFPSLASLGVGRLRSLTRKASLDGGGGGMAAAAAAAGGLHGVGRSATEPASGSAGAGGASLMHASLLEPLSMGSIVYGAEAVRRGVDTLGVGGPAWWLTGADPLAAMMEEAERLRAQVLRQREALATPLAPLEQRALHDRYASLMRPSWALDPGAFGQGSAPGQRPGPQQAAAGQPMPPPVLPHGLAF